jgi:hypothetical protein
MINKKLTYTFAKMILIAAMAIQVSCSKRPPSDLTKEIIIPRPVSVTATGDYFTIEESTFQAIKLNAERIRIISQERITEELNKILLSEKPSVGLGLLYTSGLMHIIFPKLVDLAGAEYIDGHGHWEDWFGELYLHLGITTCVNIELYQDGPWILAQRDGTNSGKIRGPRLWASGQALGTREAEAVRESARAARGEISVSSADEARTAVRKKKQDGYDIIKVNEFVPLNWLEFVVKEANELGMPVTGHSWDAIGSASAGIGGIEHIWSVGYSSITDDQKRRRIGADRLLRKIDAEQVGAHYEVNHYDRIIGAMVEHGVAWTPTVAKWLWPLSSNAERFWARAQEILADPAATKYFPAAFPYTVAQTRNRFERYNPEQLDLAKLAHENSLEFIRRFAAAGGILKEGSDPPQGMAGLQMHIGMAMDVEAGVPPMTAIQAATLNAAKTFKKDKDFGSVEAGKVADLAIVEGDPLKDIWATQNVKIVVMNGKVVDIGFHADWRNPIPAALPGHSVPKEIESSRLW